ncbi:HAD-IA family hydrolase [Candidatus Woesearchaeota archaeon]|nr:HAD-IA family hydrolase [Candidatus Woesearchaeota archaeon]
MIKAILFDLDNTLYDYTYAHKVAIKAAFYELRKHIRISYSHFSKLYKISRDETHKELAGTASAHNRILYFQRLIEKTENTIKPDIVLKLYDSYWNTLLDNMKIFPGSLEVLKYCRENDIKTAIVSDLTTRIQLRKLKKLGISGYVDVLVTSEEAGSEKPHSIMFLLTLNKLKICPEEAVMVGDNAVADIEGANFVGLTTVLLKKGNLSKMPKEEYKKPDYSIKNIKGLIKIVDDLNHIEEGYIKFKCHLKKTKPVSKKKIKDLNRYRQKLYNLGLIGAYPNKVGYGNLSKKDEDIIITGTATGNYKKLENKHYSRITGYDLKKNELWCEGQIKASSESMTHAALYGCSEEIGAVLHVHSIKMWKRYLNKLPTTSKKAAYGTPEMADEMKRLYKKTSFKNKKIAVLGGHKEGIISFGKDLKEAYDILLSYLR